ncbi:MAG: FtsX-like permease family protein [Verrucomicrobiota bacterium]
MINRASLFLALRYLKPKRTYFSIITIVSILGVIAGVTLLVVTLAVMTGFERKIKELILGFEPHIWVTRADYAPHYEDDENAYWGTVVQKLRDANHPEIKASYPYVEGPVIMQFEAQDGTTRLSSVNMVAIPTQEEFGAIDQVRQLMNGEEPDLEGEKIILSRDLADRYGFIVGDKISVTTVTNWEGLLEKVESIDEDPEVEDKMEKVKEELDLIVPQDLELTATFDSIRYMNHAYVPLFVGQSLYNLDVDAHGVGILLEEPYEANDFQPEFDELLPTFWYSQTWWQRNARFLQQVLNERAMISFLLFFIVIVAALSMMNTMITVTVQKRREIGVLKAIGGHDSQIVGVFLVQGMVVGFIGSVLGLGLGALVIRFRNELQAFLGGFGVEIFPADVYGVREIPAAIVASDVAIICGGAFLLCTLAAIGPAFVVSRLDAAKALRD